MNANKPDKSTTEDKASYLDDSASATEVGNLCSGCDTSKACHSCGGSVTDAQTKEAMKEKKNPKKTNYI